MTSPVSWMLALSLFPAPPLDDPAEEAAPIAGLIQVDDLDVWLETNAHRMGPATQPAPPEVVRRMRQGIFEERPRARPVRVPLYRKSRLARRSDFPPPIAGHTRELLPNGRQAFSAAEYRHAWSKYHQRRAEAELRQVLDRADQDAYNADVRLRRALFGPTLGY